MTSTLDQDIETALALAPDSANFLSASLGGHQSSRGYGSIDPSQSVTAYNLCPSRIEHAKVVQNTQRADDSVDHRGLLSMGVPAIVNGRKAPGASSRDKKIA